MSTKIVFTNTNDVPDIYYPKPASQFIPEWYKKMPSYIGDKKPNGKGQTNQTLKKCMPVFDAITAGYILQTYVDIYVSQKDGAPYYEWSSLNFLDMHPIIQAPNHPSSNGFDYPKFMNGFGIKTPKGYSCLFVTPFHRDAVFTILPGVVDTDTYSNNVNLPFVLNDVNFEGLIPAGTPMAQIIPFKRDKWSSKIGTKKDLLEREKTGILLKTKFYDSYKINFRQSKEYK
jgi:hypothetical protein